MLQPMPCRVLPMDAYYRDLSHLTLEERAAMNFDAPDSLDHNLLVLHLKTLAAGGSINRPIYDFAMHTRKPATEDIDSCGGVILVEGIFALFWQEIRDRLDVKVFIDLDSDICLERRIERDVKERGRTRENVRSQFFKTVLPMYDRYVAPTREYADMVFEGDAPVEVSATRVIEWVRSRCGPTNIESPAAT
jgi:uridine kinase